MEFKVSSITFYGFPMANVLDRIVATKQKEVAQLKEGTDLAYWESIAAQGPPVRSFWKSLGYQKGMGVIAEIKKASPSAGVIQSQFDPLEIAADYIAGDATAISVLTDTDYFQGSLGDLERVRHLNGPPVLRKDFLIDPVQIYQARGAGADLVLLIAEILEQDQLESLITLTQSLGMTPLVELHDPVHLNRILDAGASLVGVNNRDLRTFQVDIETTLTIAKQIPKDVTLVGESGIHSVDQVHRLWDAGVRLVLVGESLMRSGNRVETLRKFRNVGA